ncbi:uncharacterized protein PGTG_10617 [Puccinia graminis f. sp. tritici CRL 75-36-700-3]|uniref:Uncharacterized protein n=1 Tax=Puccinia graminis f. sp. tritici (strain CRL 75-36-700-3 / race SCCL) TaxID=418459 RepID=E3KIW4_PUCGT|nr:uncharacterized protein PGTG_10617 [Puccinia graminis f. sp. tritici CRL 75-36-700-3]EFP84239.2 hypothetical protein PGTG_10617 [Puccinia graminis f. sp. tritici CRL 75-36-700-3]
MTSKPQLRISVLDLSKNPAKPASRRWLSLLLVFGAPIILLLASLNLYQHTLLGPHVSEHRTARIFQSRAQPLFNDGSKFLPKDWKALEYGDRSNRIFKRSPQRPGTGLDKTPPVKLPAGGRGPPKPLVAPKGAAVPKVPKPPNNVATITIEQEDDDDDEVVLVEEDDEEEELLVEGCKHH